MIEQKRGTINTNTSSQSSLLCCINRQLKETSIFPQTQNDKNTSIWTQTGIIITINRDSNLPLKTEWKSLSSVDRQDPSLRELRSFINLQDNLLSTSPEVSTHTCLILQTQRKAKQTNHLLPTAPIKTKKIFPTSSTIFATKTETKLPQKIRVRIMSAFPEDTIFTRIKDNWLREVPDKTTGNTGRTIQEGRVRLWRWLNWLRFARNILNTCDLSNFRDIFYNVEPEIETKR